MPWGEGLSVCCGGVEREGLLLTLPSRDDIFASDCSDLLLFFVLGGVVKPLPWTTSAFFSGGE